jgi:D-threonate/D-erythronate kinase
LQDPGGSDWEFSVMAHTAVIADDLTGANDTAIQFAKYGMRTFVLWNFPQERDFPDSAEVAVIDTESRAVSPRESYEKVKEAAEELHSLGIERIYKKMDSTLRGNVGAEIRAVADVFRPDLTVIAPAFPRYGRNTISGHQYVDGRRVSMTEFARDPKSPAVQSYIPDLVRDQSGVQPALIETAVVACGISAIREAIDSRLARRENWIVFDVGSEQDLRNVAAVAAEHKNVLWVGSTGLATILPECLAWKPRVRVSTASRATGPALVIAGSVSATVRDQIGALQSDSSVVFIPIDPVRALRDPAAEVSECVTRGRASRKQSPCAIVITSASDPDARNWGMTEGVRLGISGREVAERIAIVLGSIAAELAPDGFAGMVLTGGDTSIEVCRALQGKSLEVIEEIAPGIPLCELTVPLRGSIRIVTKAGGFGDRDALVKAVFALR